MEVKSAPWRSPLSTAIRKDENGTKDTFQRLEKLLASAVSICRLKGTVECQTGGLITVCEEMQRLLRCSFSDIARLEKEMQKLQTNYEEQLGHLKEKVANIEQEKDGAKMILENMIRRMNSSPNDEDLDSDSQNMEVAQTPVPVEEDVMDNSDPYSLSVAEDEACEVNKTEDPVEGRKGKPHEGGKVISDQSNDSQKQGRNKVKSHKIDVIVVVEDLPVSQKRPISQKRLSSKMTGKQSHRASPPLPVHESVSEAKILDESGQPPLMDKSTSPSKPDKKKLRISRNSKKSKKAAANEVQDDPKKTSNSSEGTLPAKNAKSEDTVLEVQVEGGDDAILEKSEAKNSKVSGNLTKKSKTSSEPAKEMTERMQVGETESSSHSTTERPQTPENAKDSKKIEKDEPLGDMSFLLDVNLKISEFVTSSELELELPLMTGRQRTDVYKLTGLYRLRARMGNKSDNLTTLRLSKTPESQMPKNGKVDCLLSELSIAATKEADSPKQRAGKRKQPSLDDHGTSTTTKKHLAKTKKA